VRCGAPIGKSRPVGHFQRPVHQRFELSAVVDRSDRGLIWHRGRRNEIAPSHRNPVDPELARGTVEQSLDQVDRLRSPSTAIRTQRGGIGENQLYVNLDRGNPVDTRQAVLGVRRAKNCRVLSGVRSDADKIAHAQREDVALHVECQIAFENAVAAMRVREEAFDAAVAPFHRSAGFPCGVKDGAILGIGLSLHPKPAADVISENPYLRKRHLEDAFGKQLSHHRHALRGRNQRIALGFLVPHANACTRLQRDRRKPCVLQAHPLDMRGFREGGLDRCTVAVPPVERNVARRPVVAERGAFG